MKKIIKTELAPLPIGPYNQAVVAGNLVFVSGQIALDPASGTLVQESLEAETHQVLKNLRAVLEAAGSSLQNVVKTTVFIKDMNQFGRINAVYAEYFQDSTAPARETVEVAALPKFVQVEISAIALIG
jgi:2-iminobutanoate/2-iminopropanoate deaminase